MRTLVLDQGYQPHRIISWQRAVCMIFDGKVEVVEEYDEDVRSVSITIKMPAVVRLLRHIVGRKRAIKFSRINVAMRDDFKCQYCGVRHRLRGLTYDHVVPKSQGGKTNWENIVMACYGCNEKKGNCTPRQAGLRLRRPPVKPKWLPVVAFRVDPASSIPEAWANWVYWHGRLESDP
ncbi:MAG: HNH endonuclease [Myxococcales bacterium]|nr:HNH endonuclease [Deltaproteobacteria bacterium]NNE19598.1 HNH endonuclease [Myxococcales bacterium]